MSACSLYTAFHANLDFSAIPDSDRADVIARCYWPLLALPEEHGVPIGVEMPVRTLEALAREDPEWTKRFAGLIERDAIELIGSGHAQVVAPLAPTAINRLNLSLGVEGYRRLIGRVPETWFVNEQTWSDGLTPLYREIGARQIVMEWNNPAAARPELRSLRCRPARLACARGEGPVVLWNDSIVFQKIQRAAHGETPFRDALDYVAKLARRPEAESLCAYGGDVEIFDYRPSRSRRETLAEMPRLIEMFARLDGEADFAFRLPRDVVAESDVAGPVLLGSATDPVPCKKQPRYNPTRWAVSGRDGFGMNTRCHALVREERAARSLSHRGDVGASASVPDRTLVDLFRSDFRTRATEEKIVAFEAEMGRARHDATARLDAATPRCDDPDGVVVTNPFSHTWNAGPIEVPLRFAPGRFEHVGVEGRSGPALPPGRWQIDEIGRHRDGSLREARLVLDVPLGPGASRVVGLVAASAGATEGDGTLDLSASPRVRTPSVDARFLPHRGAALESLAFPGLDDAPCLGTIPHGSFDAIAFTPDFYSGHVVAVTERSEKRADLSPTSLHVVPTESGALRTTIEARFESPFGPWWKRYRLYHDAPRVDVIHRLSFHDARLASLRLGICTLRPEAWDRARLTYGTTNGGAGVEWRQLLGGAALRQSSAVSASVSATSCLGATEGWVAFSDGRRGLTLSHDPAQAAVATLLDFEDVDDAFFCRVSHSAAETDETRASFLRGRLDFAFAIEGFDPRSGDAIAPVRARAHGLVYRTENDVGISSGL